MKKLFLLGAAVCALWSCTSSVEGYKVNVAVKGDLSQLKSDTLILTNSAEIADTVVLAEGKAAFEGAKLDTPQYVMLVTKGEKPQRLARLFLENGVSSIDINFVEGARPEIALKGGRFQTVSDSLSALQQKLFETNNMDSLMKAYGTADEETKAAIYKLYDSLSKVAEGYKAEYIAAHPTSLYALDNLAGSLEEIEIAEAEAKLAAFKALPEYAANKNVEKVENTINILKSLQPGQIAPDFVQNDTEGNPVKFSDFYKKNKVTMVDFWASWCGPCRAFNPTLTKIYKEYKKKGFGIIGVSLDRDKDAWLKAIKDDKLDWVHVSDLGFWNNEVAKQYHVRYIPQSIFVDQEGKILKRQPSHEEIEELLKANL